MKSLILISLVFLGLRSYSQVEYTSGGSASIYTLVYPSNIVSLSSGLSFTFKANHSSLGSSTMNINSLGPIPIKKEVTIDLIADDIRAGQIVTIVYDGTNFQMTSKAGTSGGGASIYSSDGALTGNRTATIGTNKLTFNGTGDGESIFVSNSGTTAAASNDVYGLYSQATSSNATSNIGVGLYGFANGNGEAYGVRGLAQSSGDNYGGYFEANGTGISNTGGYFTASGGTNNYAAVFDNGNVGIGTTSPSEGLTLEDVLIMMAAIPAPGVTTDRLYNVSGDLFWDGVQLNQTVAAGWGLTGNAGTAPGTNFIGTTDTRDLTIRTNNIEKARITQTGQIEILNTGRSVMIGEGAGAAMDFSVNRFNTLVGYRAGATVSTNFRTTAIGSSALETNTASDNTAVGASALTSNTSAQGNTAVGSRTLMATTTGGNNTAIGNMSMTVTTGFQNTAVGASSLLANTTGNNNNAFGLGALISNLDGSSNSAFGNSALQLNTAGDNNSAFGGQSLASTTGSENIALGYDAGSTNGGGDRNSFIGTFSDVSSAALTNATAIGHRAFVAQSNSLVLGSISGLNGASNNTNVGIGTAAPSEVLEVVGNISIVDDNNRLIRKDNGNEDYLPVAYGVINDGTVQPNASTSNFTVVKAGAGRYQVTYVGPRTFSGLGEFQLSLAPYYQGTTLIATYQYLGGKTFEIFLTDLGDSLTDGIVSFTLRLK